MISLKDKKIIMILSLILLITVVFIISHKKETSFELDDRCGPIMNLISHSIKDEYACTSQCRSQCGVKELKFTRMEFVENQAGCNNCTCFCR